MVQLNWSTASDWDNSQAERQVVHESVGVRSADTVSLGYPTYDEFGGTSLLAYYPMDAQSGGAWQAPVGPTPSLVGTTAGATGIAGSRARTFDGSDDQASLSVSWSAPFTWSCYIKPASVGSVQSIGQVGANWSNEQGSLLQIDPDVVNVSLAQTFYVGTVTLQAGVWQHVGIAIDTDGTIRSVVDGVEDIDTTGTPPANGWASGVTIGSESYWNYFTGDMDEFRFYDRALSFSELKSLHITDGYLTTGSKSPS